MNFGPLELLELIKLLNISLYNREVGKNICDIMRPLFKEVHEDRHLSMGYALRSSGTFGTY